MQVGREKSCTLCKSCPEQTLRPLRQERKSWVFFLSRKGKFSSPRKQIFSLPLPLHLVHKMNGFCKERKRERAKRKKNEMNRGKTTTIEVNSINSALLFKCTYYWVKCTDSGFNETIFGTGNIF